MDSLSGRVTSDSRILLDQPRTGERGGLERFLNRETSEYRYVDTDASARLRFFFSLCRDKLGSGETKKMWLNLRASAIGSQIAPLASSRWHWALAAGFCRKRSLAEPVANAIPLKVDFDRLEAYPTDAHSTKSTGP